MIPLTSAINISQFSLVSLFLSVILGFNFVFTEPSYGDTLPQDSLLANVPVSLTEDSFVARAVDKTGDAVVRIDTQKIVTRNVDPVFEDPFFGQFFGDEFRNQIPRERVINGQGSGFIISRDGILLTNAHVVSGADKVTVKLKDGRSFSGEVKGTDQITDLAVVKINYQGESLPVASLGDSDEVRVGDWAIAVGNPVGLDNTVTLGIISTLHRPSSEVGILDKRIDFLQTDAAINPGNSGGPLLNAQGEVIGINTAIRADAMGIGFAIPINKAKELQGFLAQGKQVPHAYIGIQMLNINPELAKLNNDDPNSIFYIPEVEGILIAKVLPDTPAQKGGLRRGDVITKIDDEPITDVNKLQKIVENSGINRNLNFTVARGDRQLNIDVKTEQMRS
jgi:S1-C subfamily serine protease